MSSFLEEDKVKINTTYRELFLRLWPYLVQQKGLLTIVVLAIVGLAGISRALPFLIGYAVDHGFREKSINVLGQVAWIYLCIEVLKTFFTFIHKYLFQLLGARILGKMREDLLAHVQSLPMRFFHKNPSGRIVTRMTNDIGVLSEVFSEGVVTLASQIAILLSIVIAMLLISPLVTVLTLITTPFFIYFTYRLTEKIKLILRDQKKKLSEINSYVAEHIAGIRIADLYNQKKTSEQQFEKLSFSYRDLNMKSIRSYALMQPALNLMNAAVVASALFWAGWSSIENALALGSVVAFVLHAQDMIPPIREILEKYQLFQNSLTSAERIFALFDETIEKTNWHDSLQKISEETFSLQKAIHIDRLSFQYDEGLPWALQNLNLHIPQGSSLALVGHTGSGKSTLVNLIQRFYEPPVQSIKIGDVPLEKIPFSVLRSKIGVIQQDPFIFKGTILSNITLGDITISLESVNRASQELGFLDYLKARKKSLNDSTEEKGSNLSLGERQLIAFIRMMVRNPDILILDEATANIDSTTESFIQNATRKLLAGRTSIVIAHRLSTIQECQQIAVLDHGQLVELGSHSELMARKGVYYQLAEEGSKSTTILASAAGTAVP